MQNTMQNVHHDSIGWRNLGYRSLGRGQLNNRRKFWSQTSDNMDRWKAEQGRGREKRKIRRKKSRRERVRRKKMQMREKVKSRNTVFFPMIWGSGGSKSRLAKAAGAELAGQMKNCTPLWHEAYFQVKMHKTHQVRTTFGSSDVEKVHAVVARSTFRSQNVKNTRGSDNFWRFRCRKSACRCGAEHISKSKCSKNQGFGPLLEVQMSKKCMPLWREANFEVKMFKALGVRTTFGGSDVTSLRYTTLHYTPLHYTTGHYIKLHSSTLHYTTPHPSTLHFTKLHYTTLHYTTLRSATLHYTPSHYTTLHYITLYYTIFHYTSLPSTTLHSITLQLQLQLHNCTLLLFTTLNYTTLHYTTLHYTTLHYTTLHYIPPHSTTPHYITLHYITLNDTAPQIDS